jgi:hypothetical protein
MLNDLPTELLLNVLSFLDNLNPLSASNRTLSSTVRDYQASQLRSRLARLSYANLLMSIWPPPSFFRRDPRAHKHAQPVHVNDPPDFIDVLRDPEMTPRVEAYITSLERKAWVARKMAGHLMLLVNFAGFRNNHDRMSYVTALVLYLWSAEQRYAHDPDGYIDNLRDECDFRDLLVRDHYLADLPVDTQGWLEMCYDALSHHLKPPFVPRGRGGEGLWLQRLIVRVCESN